MIERWHRSLKNSLKTRLINSNTSWIDELPTVLLGLRAAIREDTGVSAAELTYGRNLRLPADFFETTSSSSLDHTYIEQLRKNINSLKPKNNVQRHGNQRNIFIHRDLLTCEYVFLRNDAVRKPLQTPYDGPYKVLRREEKYFVIQLPDRTATVSIDRLKPAYILSEDYLGESTSNVHSPVILNLPNTNLPVTLPSHNNNLPQNTSLPLPVTSQPLPSATAIKQKTPASPVQKTTRTGRAVRLPVRFA
ncbi:uncharacterized protein LOC121736727 [Aricia agestis]|uniref:uncharacterized protein LOC121736727 n=1 Tax=Aricia agestis TaxID=91739 RepID=UPI001C207542|nr:uncharacterized protein LOC121736727 [Aricia agestis]